jgi:hypothetical protein
MAYKKKEGKRREGKEKEDKVEDGECILGRGSVL